MNYLIVDLNIEFNGHKFGFVNQLINWLKINAVNQNSYHFLTNLGQDKFSKTSVSNIHLSTPNEEETHNWNSVSAVKKYQFQWKYIAKFAQEHKIDQVILMEFDLYQGELGKVKQYGFNISGIWFRPYVRQKFLRQGLKESLTFKAKHAAKKVAFKWAMRNESVNKVFILNDAYSVNLLNKKFNNRLAYLPDPVFDIDCSDSLNVREKYSIEDNKIIFLIFGCIDDRKNVVNVLEAIATLPKLEQEKVVLMIVGKVTDDYRPQIEQKLEEIKDRQFFEIHRNDKFVDDCEMEALFEACDVVLRMNINYFASSGIIGVAAKYHKPSIVSNYGIVADITKQYELGREVDPLHIEEIQKAVLYFLKKENRLINGTEYYQKHDRDAYASTLFTY